MTDLKQLGQDWDTFGKADPLWAVISWPEKRGGKWEKSDLYGLGQEEINEVLRAVRSLKLPLRTGKALDFGSGVGRLTESLAEHFGHVVGVDIAPSMVNFARAHSRFPASVEYRLNTTGDLQQFPDNTFDFVLSKITLQHVPREFIPGYLCEFTRVLAPGGVLMFQLPSGTAPTLKGMLWRVLPKWVLAEVLRLKNDLPVRMQMNTIPRAEVEQLLKAQGMTLMATDADTAAGPNWVSYRYIAIK